MEVRETAVGQTRLVITQKGRLVRRQDGSCVVMACTLGGGMVRNKELPERLVSPRGSSLGSLDTLGVAHPTTNRVKQNLLF